MNDTVKPAIVFHLQEPIESITATRDTVTGTFYYQLQIEEQKSPTTQKLLVNGIIALVIILCLWLFTRKRYSKKASSYNQFKQTDIYKLMHEKGYYSANKKPVFEAVSEQETNELSETVLQIFASFSDFLKKSDLNEKRSAVLLFGEISLNDIGIVGDILRFAKCHLQKETENQGITGI